MMMCLKNEGDIYLVGISALEFLSAIVCSSIDFVENLRPKGLLEHMQLSHVVFLGLNHTPGQQQLSVKIFTFEHGLECLGEFPNAVEALIVLETYPVLFVEVFDELDRIELLFTHLQVFAKEL